MKSSDLPNIQEHNLDNPGFIRVRFSFFFVDLTDQTKQSIRPMFRNLRLVYITAKNRDEALMIGKTIVEEQLAACANIIDGMESVYRWKGEIASDKEAVLILKTTYGNVSRLTKRVKELHSYEVPCIISINLAEQEGNAAYLDWLRSEVHQPMGADDDYTE